MRGKTRRFSALINTPTKKPGTALGCPTVSAEQTDADAFADSGSESFGEEDPEGIRERAQKAGEQAIGDLAQALLENPLFSQAVSAGFSARDKALGAQHAAMGALNLPSASEVERLERRLRSVSQRLETVEEQVDRIARDVAAIRRSQEASDGPPADQKRLTVDD
jgi:hypothetical protein